MVSRGTCTVLFKSLHSSVTALTLAWKQGKYWKIQVPLRSRWIVAAHCQYCPLWTEAGTRAHQRSEGRDGGCSSSRHPREQLPDAALSFQCPNDNISAHLCCGTEGTHTKVSYTWYLQLAAPLGCQHSELKTLMRWDEENSVEGHQNGQGLVHSPPACSGAEWRLFCGATGGPQLQPVCTDQPQLLKLDPCVRK